MPLPNVHRMATKKKRSSYQLTGQPDWITNVRWHLIAIALFSILLYANTFTHGYVQDDAIVIEDNEFTQRGIAGIPDLLRYDTFRGFFKVEGKDQLVAGGRYRPLTLILFAVEVQLFGLNPTVGHIMNTLYYALTCVMLYLVLLRLGFLNWKKKKRTFAWADTPAHVFTIALLTTILFATHPVHTEVVANIKGRDEIVTLLGGLLAMYFSLRAVQNGRWFDYLLAGGFFFLGLLAKETVIPFVVLIPLAIWVFQRRQPVVALRAAVPLVVAAVVFLVIRFSIISGFGAESGELMNNPFLKVEDDRYVPFTWSERMATITYTLGKYLQLLIFPYPLTHDYYPRHVEVLQFTDWRVLLSLVANVVLMGFGLLRTWRRDPIGYAVLFYFGMLFLVSNLIFPIGTHMAERFLFSPSMGFALAVALLLYRFCVSRAVGGKLSRFVQLQPAYLIAGGLVALFSVMTVTRNAAWESNYKLFTTDIKTSPNSAKLLNAVGGELTVRAQQLGDGARRTAQLREAETYLKRALEIHPNYKNVYLQLGNVHNYLREYEEAITYYQQALTLDPDYADAQNNLAITYRQAGEYYGKVKGDLPRSLDYLQRALELQPNDYQTVFMLGTANGIAGNNQLAVEYFARAVRLEPDNPDALFNLGSAYYNTGQDDKGAELHRRAQELDPEVYERNVRNRN